MTTKAAARRWSWRRWLDRVESSDLSDAHKEYCRRLMRVSRAGGRGRRWVANWELDAGDHGYGEAMEFAERLGLAYRKRGEGIYIATDDPPPPRPGSIRLTAGQRSILADLIDGCGTGDDWRLYWIEKPGYFTDDKSTRWMLRCWVTCQAKAVSQASARSLARRRLVEPDGCHCAHAAYSFVFANWKVHLLRGLAEFTIDHPPHWLKPETRRRAAARLRGGYEG